MNRPFYECVLLEEATKVAVESATLRRRRLR
jgi:hypothetical protein